jgi:hypothetical protein
MSQISIVTHRLWPPERALTQKHVHVRMESGYERPGTGEMRPARTVVVATRSPNSHEYMHDSTLYSADHTHISQTQRLACT